MPGLGDVPQPNSRQCLIICFQVRYPRRLPFNVGRVIKAAAGASACAVLTQTGQVYVWGFGILGLGPNVESLSEPQVWIRNR